MRCPRDGFRLPPWSWLLACVGILSLAGCSRWDSRAIYRQGVIFDGDGRYNFNDFSWSRDMSGNQDATCPIVVHMSAGDLGEDELSSPEKMREFAGLGQVNEHEPNAAGSSWHFNGEHLVEIRLIDAQSKYNLTAFYEDGVLQLLSGACPTLKDEKKYIRVPTEVRLTLNGTTVSLPMTKEELIRNLGQPVSIQRFRARPLFSGYGP